MKKIAVISAILCLFSTIAVSADENEVVVFGPGFQKAQQSSRALKYTPPQSWISDTNFVKKLGLYDILVTKGKTIETSAVAITIAFQKKNKDIPALSNLESFFKADMANLLSRFPDAQFARWQPSKLDPEKIPFMSIEIFGEGQQPSPHRVLFIDTGDGYYSITATAAKRDILDAKEFVDFFNSIDLE